MEPTVTPAPAAPAPAEPVVEDPEGTDEPVDEYLFGIPLTSIPEADRATFIKEWTETNKTIQKLQRANAEETPPPAPAAPEQPVTVADLSDADIATAAGLDPEALDDPAVKVAIASLRGFAELKAQVDLLGSTTSAAETQRVWEASLDALDTQYGELPIDRSRLLEIAADEGITDPEAAYWRVAGPVRAEVMKALEAQLAKTAKAGKRAASSPRPVTSAEVDNNPVKSKNVKDAVKEAADAAIRQLGITLTN